MAGRDHHSTNSVLLFHRQRYRRSWRRLRRQNNLITVSRKNLPLSVAQIVRQKPPVITNDHLGFRSATGCASQASAVAWATRSRFRNVKSSAMTARQPSVPNLMPLIMEKPEKRRFKVSRRFALRPSPGSLPRHCLRYLSHSCHGAPETFLLKKSGSADERIGPGACAFAAVA